MKLNPDNIYDSLAHDYDSKVLSDNLNEEVREYIKNKSLAFVTKTSVALDFGGGTGLDIKWLSESCNYVLFCEPSEQMRHFAEKRIKEYQLKNVTISTETDFTKWDSKSLFLKSGGVDFILSNFAVVNSILDIELLFAKLAVCLNQNGVLVISILNGFPVKYTGFTFFRKINNKLKFYLMNKSYILNKTGHLTAIHTNRKVKSSAKKDFILIESKKIAGSMFTCYTFKKK